MLNKNRGCANSQTTVGQDTLNLIRDLNGSLSVGANREDFLIDGHLEFRKSETPRKVSPW